MNDCAVGTALVIEVEAACSWVETTVLCPLLVTLHDRELH